MNAINTVVGRFADSVTVSATVHIIFWVNVFYPTVRLSAQPANYACFALAQLLPLNIIRLSGSSRRYSRGLALALGLFLLVPAVPSGCAAAACVVMSVPTDRSFERQNAIPTPFGLVALYVTNGGATTAFGIIVRQECRVLPGVLIVRELADEYPADKAALDMPRPGFVRIVFQDSSLEPPVTNERTFRLRHFCWGPYAV